MLERGVKQIFWFWFFGGDDKALFPRALRHALRCVTWLVPAGPTSNKQSLRNTKRKDGYTTRDWLENKIGFW